MIDLKSRTRRRCAVANETRDWRIYADFPWAPYKPTQHAIKLQTLLDLRGQIPTVSRITPAPRHAVKMLDHLTPEAGAFYIMDPRRNLDIPAYDAANSQRIAL